MKCSKCKETECKHENIVYCESCKKAECQDCGKTWTDNCWTTISTDTVCIPYVISEPYFSEYPQWTHTYREMQVILSNE